MTESEMKQKEKELKDREDALAKLEKEAKEAGAGKKEAPKEKTKFYKLLKLAPKEQKGQVLNQSPRFLENGGIYETGDVIELTESRLKSLGVKYFELLTDKEYDAWEESGRSLKFLPAVKK